MIDLYQVLGFDWDAANERKSLDKHGVSTRETEETFVVPQLLIAEDMKRSQDEARYQALGQTATGRLLHLTFTLRANATRIRVISARDANRKERLRYESQT